MKKYKNRFCLFSKKLTALGILLLLFLSFRLNASTYYSIASGDWSSSSTWGTSCGGGTGFTPTASDNIVICNGYTITVNSNVTCNKLTVRQAGILTIVDGILTVSDDFTAKGTVNQLGGTLQFNNTGVWSSNGIYNATGGITVFNGNTKLDTVTMVASFTFFDLVINSGKTFNQNNVRNINIKKDWTNNGGIYIHSKEKVTFNGNLAQSINGTSATTFDSLTINNSSATGVTLQQSDTINSVFTLIDGYVYTDVNNLIVVKNNATSTSGSSASFVSGPMKKIGNDPFVFPVGIANTSTIWARLEMVNDSNFRHFNASTEFTCAYYHSSAPHNSNEYMPGTINHISNTEYWDLERTYDVANNAQCNVRLYWEDVTRSGINDISKLKLAHYNSNYGYYEDLHGIATGGNSGSIVSTVPLKFFSPFTFGSSEGGNVNPLPIELLSFEATPHTDNVGLTWTTAAEVNNDFFTLEKSSDGINFDFVGKQKGAGNSSKIINYAHVDENPFWGVSYYRLKQTDFDGNETYSDIEKINFQNENLFLMIHPNPNSSNSFNLTWTSNNKEDVLVEILDVYGNKVYSEVFNAFPGSNNTFIVNVSQSLPLGLYSVIATSSQKSANTKLLVVN